jgi:glycyl-tRNA synthetase beta chain
MPNKNLLLEIGTEELPPKSLKQLMLSLEKNLAGELSKAGFVFAGTKSFATPRRLAVFVEDLAETQEDQEVEKRGPAIKAAFDGSGEPTRALMGFAKSCGVEDLSTLETLSTDKGEWLVYKATQPGKSLSDEIDQLIANSLVNLPIERRMRWGNSRMEFVRPVHWIVLLHGSDILPGVVLGHTTGRTTRGHRFMSDGDYEVASANDYLDVLKSASVIADFNLRRQKISEQLQQKAETLNGNLELDDSLLDEVTALVEWPCALTGSFDESFLEVPEEALISAMKEHQRYFHLTNNNGKLLPNFITVSNIESKEPTAVIAGNERVIRPRLSDASFFFKKDASTTMDEKLERLANVVFQSELGTFLEKAQRVSNLAEFIGNIAGAEPSDCKRAGLLCKADLVSDMVGEFPDLQGIMGSYYSLNDGESNDVSLAIREHYLPSQSGGALPANIVGSCVALADKIDTLVGLFSIGQPPTGSRDPFALRRQALGVIRICIENKISINLLECLESSAESLKEGYSPLDVQAYILDRLGNWYGESGIDQDVFNAVRYSRAGITDLLEADHRIRSMQVFRQHEQSANLIAANKRVANILKKADIAADSSPSVSLFQEVSETSLADNVKSVQQAFSSGKLDYEDKFLHLAQLQPYVDQYFDDVMVMTDDEALKNNRLAALAELRAIFLEVADFSLIQT